LKVRSGFAIVLLIALILPILAACGGGTPAASTTPVPAAATAAPAEAPTAAGAEAPTAAAGGATGKAKPGILRTAITADPATIDPQKTSFSTENTFVLMNYEPLMRFNLEMEPIPGQAESYEVSADGLKYTFKIRPNSKYSDGSPLTAKNFEYAWKRLADPLVAGEYQNLPCGIIKGYSEYAVTNCPNAEGKT
jgi:oligopeptide transport system substrate-binding protein